MIKRKVVIENDSGLHARPAADFCKLASGFPCEVILNVKDKSYNGKSLLKILSAGISKGTKIEIVCEGEKEEEALQFLLASLNEKSKEENL